MSNIYYWEKLTFSKLRFSPKESLKKCPNLEEQKGTSYIRGNVYTSFVYKTMSQISFKLFCSRDKRLLSESFGNEVDFRDITNVSLNILAKNQNFKKLRHGFVDERAVIKTILMSSCHWKILVPFCLRKRRLKNPLLTLTVNYFKIIQQNKLCHWKQQ